MTMPPDHTVALSQGRRGEETKRLWAECRTRREIAAKSSSGSYDRRDTAPVPGANIALFISIPYISKKYLYALATGSTPN